MAMSKVCVAWPYVAVNISDKQTSNDGIDGFIILDRSNLLLGHDLTIFQPQIFRIGF